MKPSEDKSPNKLFNIKTAIAFGITIAFILAVEYFIGFSRIVSSWQQLSPTIVILAFALLSISYALRAVRIQSYYSMKSRQEFLLCTKATLLHNFYNNFLPMRTGELSFPILLKQYFGIELSNSIGALLIFRLLDLHVIALLSLLCAIFIFPTMTIALVFIIILWCLTPILLFKFKEKLDNKLNITHKNKLIHFLHKMFLSLPNTQNQLTRAYFWTALNWLVKLLVLSWIIVQFHEMTAESAMISVIFGDLTSVLPIHGLAGAGTYEAGVLLGASFFQYEPKAIVAAAINLHLFILASSALALIFVPFIKQTKKA